LCDFVIRARNEVPGQRVARDRWFVLLVLGECLVVVEIDQRVRYRRRSRRRRGAAGKRLDERKDAGERQQNERGAAEF